jgi:hypothetical protein
MNTSENQDGLFDNVVGNLGAWHSWELGDLHQSPLLLSVFRNKPYPVKDQKVKDEQNSFDMQGKRIEIRLRGSHDASCGLVDVCGTWIVPIEKSNPSKLNLFANRIRVTLYPFVPNWAYRVSAVTGSIFAALEIPSAASSTSEQYPMTVVGGIRRLTVSLCDTSPFMQLDMKALNFVLNTFALSGPGEADKSLCSLVTNIVTNHAKARFVDETQMLSDVDFWSINVQVSLHPNSATRQQTTCVLMSIGNTSIVIPKSFLT